MNNFLIGSVVTLVLVLPVIIFLAMNNNQSSPSVSGTSSQLQSAGELPGEIFTVNENCINQISDTSVGAISSECQNYESFLTNDFIDKVREVANNEETVDCAKDLPKDLTTLHKKISGSTAQMVIEGKKTVDGTEGKDLEVDFIRTEDDWEISDIRCLN